MITVDFLVIGAGIAGASVGAELARRGSVLILEAEDRPGYHSTGRSASIFIESHANETLRALVQGSRAFFVSPPEGFADQVIVRDRGVLFIARSDQLDALASIVDKNYEGSTRVIRADRSFALQKHPALRPEYVAACLWDPDAMDIDVNVLLHGFLADFRRSGGQVYSNQRVTELHRDGDRWAVKTDNSTYRATVVVNAAGAWAEKIGEMAGAETIGLISKRRSACIIPVAQFDVSDWPTLGDVDQQFYCKPDAGNLLLSPAEETPVPPCDADADELEIARAVECLEAATVISVTRKIRHQWAGLRSFVADKLPVVGYDSKTENFFWLAGLGGDGIQSSPALSRLAAALVVGAPVPRELLAAGVTKAALSPHRLSNNQNN